MAAHDIISVLDDPRGRQIVDFIEEALSDLRDQPGRVEFLDFLRIGCEQLQREFGYTYQHEHL